MTAVRAETDAGDGGDTLRGKVKVVQGDALRDASQDGLAAFVHGQEKGSVGREGQDLDIVLQLERKGDAQVTREGGQ